MENPKRRILHINIVNFSVAVVRALSPRLDSYPVAVATQGRQKRVVLDMSLEAREAGVRRNMLLDEALRKCRDLVVTDLPAAACERAHNAILKESLEFSPVVETAGPGHVFLDLTGTSRLWGNAADTSEVLRRTISNKYRLTSTAGLSGSKLISKIATRVIKPVGFCSVIHGCEESFIAPLPVYMMPGMDNDVVKKILQFNITTVGELQRLPLKMCERALGAAAPDILRIAFGIDDTPVTEFTAKKQSIEEISVLKGQTNDENMILPELFGMVERAASRMRKNGLASQRLDLTLEYSDHLKSEQSFVFQTPVNGDITLCVRIKEMFMKAYTRRVRLSSLKLKCLELCSPWGQTDLFYDGEAEQKLVAALDAVRGKFGAASLQFCRNSALSRENSVNFRNKIRDKKINSSENTPSHCREKLSGN